MASVQIDLSVRDKILAMAEDYGRYIKNPPSFKETYESLVVSVMLYTHTNTHTHTHTAAITQERTTHPRPRKHAHAYLRKLFVPDPHMNSSDIRIDS